MFIFVMSYVCQNVIQFVLDFFSGELDLGTLGSYSGSPFLTPDAFLRSPDKDVLGECWPSFTFQLMDVCSRGICCEDLQVLLSSHL
jgi:hypothetical protein